jgi:hypothetical protein
MLYQLYLLIAITALVLIPCEKVAGTEVETRPGNTCIQCHAGKRTGFVEGHAFGADNCVICHGGDSSATTAQSSHAGMTGFPGLLDNAQRSCGTCHADKVLSVSKSLMHTGRGMVSVTREIIDGSIGNEASANLQSLGHGPADSMLRKLCSSCHLGQKKSAHKLDPVRDRGGFCLACHINGYPEEAHPALSANVSDARCFGCHSRSARISLSYSGLAEIDPATAGRRETVLRLSDGRRVERKPADVHFTSGMNCISCHKGSALMAGAGDAVHQRDAVATRCVDCHEIDHASGQPHDPAHERLECATCHSQWVAQCFGCHMEYDADGSQWDHIEQQETAGRWHEQRSDFRNELGALGVNAANRIELFTPGMIMTLSHPDWDVEKFVRLFAPISPHTTGPSRSCESCHRSSVALGLGQGVIDYRDNEIHFAPAHAPLRDGLPADAWTNVDGTLGGRAPLRGQRPLNRQEMEAVLKAPLPDPD